MSQQFLPIDDSIVPTQLPSAPLDTQDNNTVSTTAPPKTETNRESNHSRSLVFDDAEWAAAGWEDLDSARKWDALLADCGARCSQARSSATYVTDLLALHKLDTHDILVANCVDAGVGLARLRSLIEHDTFELDDLEAYAEFIGSGFPLAAIPEWFIISSDVSEAREWMATGLTAFQCQELQAIGLDWPRALFPLWHREGFLAEQVHRWCLAGFGLEDAVAWCEQGLGVSDAAWFRDAGFGPIEAARVSSDILAGRWTKADVEMLRALRVD